MNSIDPLQLQRLIDGELNSSDVQEMLLEASDSPKQWEEIATGFVENQLWSQVVRTNAEPKLAPANLNVLVESKKSESSDLVSMTPPVSFPWFALAASMLLAAILGYGLNQIRNDQLGNIGQSNSIVQSKPLETSPLEPPAPLLAQNDDESNPGFTKADYHFEVPNDNEHLNNLVGQPSEPVPLYRVENAKQWQAINDRRLKSSALPPELIKRLTGSGYQMEQELELISGRLGDGSTFVVPVQTIRFLPNQ